MLKYKILFCIICINLFRLQAQHMDGVNIQCFYSANFIHHPNTKNKITHDETVLNIGKHSSSFYSLWESKIKHVKDSLLIKGANFSQIQGVLEKFPRSYNNIEIYKHLPVANKLVFVNKIATIHYMYEEPMEKPKWKILPEKKSLLGYSCQKATTEFRGRLWEAWFTSQIPISEGPWKFWGLPGLILAVQDSSHQFVFTCSGVKQLKNEETIQIPKANYTKCTRVKYLEMEKLSNIDPDEYIFQVTGHKMKSYEVDGKPIQRKPDYNPIEM